MAVTVTIPGFGEVQAQNAAQDDTLNRIASILTDIAAKEGAKLSAGSVKALDRASKKAAMSTRKAGDELEDLGRDAEDAGSNISGLSAAARNVNQAFSGAATALRSTKDTFGSGLDTLSAFIQQGGKALSDSLRSAGEGVPFGGIFAGLAGAATAAGAALLAMVSETAKSYQALQQAGGSFGYSLEAVRDQANMAGLRLDQFQNVFARNTKVFAAFGGSTAEGAMQFSKLNREVFRGRGAFAGVGRDLLRMGIGFEEQAEGVADAMQQFKLAGMNLQSMANPAAAVGRYQLIQARQLKVLTQLNGTTMEQEKAKQKAMRDDATNRMILSKYTGEDRLKVEAAMKQAESLMVGGGKLFLQQMESGGPMTSGMAMMAMQYPEFAKQTGLMAQGIKGGRLSLEETSTFMARNMSEAAHAADSQRVGATAGVLALGGVSNDYVDSAKKLFVHGENLGLALSNVTKIFTDLDRLSKPATGMTDTLLDTVQGQQDIQVALGTLMTRITGTNLARDLVLDPAAGAVTGLATWAETVVKATDAIGEKGLTGAAKQLQQMFENLLPDWLRGLAPAGPASMDKGLQGGSANDFLAGGAGGDTLAYASGAEHMTHGTFATPTSAMFESIMPSMQKMMDDMVASTQGGAAMLAGTETTAMQDEIMRSAVMPRGTDDVGRKRDVEDAMLALPGLLMDNTEAINKANVENQDSLDVFYRAVV